MTTPPHATDQPPLRLRPATRADADGLTALVGSCYAEYGDRLDLDSYDSDLLDVERSFLAKGAAFVVLEAPDGTIAGSHAAVPLSPQGSRVATLRRLYLLKKYRGQQWGDKLMHWALDWLREKDTEFVRFWSDTRFTRAHQFFLRFGFERGRVRHMDDFYKPYSEFEFTLNLGKGCRPGPGS